MKLDRTHPPCHAASFYYNDLLNSSFPDFCCMITNIESRPKRVTTGRPARSRHRMAPVSACRCYLKRGSAVANTSPYRELLIFKVCIFRDMIRTSWKKERKKTFFNVQSKNRAYRLWVSNFSNTHTKKGSQENFFSLNLNEKVNDKPRKAAAAS